jgi:hypothetical protein
VIGRRRFVYDDIEGQAAVFERNLRQDVHFGDDARMIAAKRQRLAKMLSEETEAFTLVQLHFERQEAHWGEPVRLGDSKAEWMRDPCLHEADVQAVAHQSQPLSHHLPAGAPMARFEAHHQAAKWWPEKGKGITIKSRELAAVLAALQTAIELETIPR